jgi:exonuclease III
MNYKCVLAQRKAMVICLQEVRACIRFSAGEREEQELESPGQRYLGVFLASRSSWAEDRQGAKVTLLKLVS